LGSSCLFASLSNKDLKLLVTRQMKLLKYEQIQKTSRSIFIKTRKIILFFCFWMSWVNEYLFGSSGFPMVSVHILSSKVNYHSWCSNQLYLTHTKITLAYDTGDWPVRQIETIIVNKQTILIILYIYSDASGKSEMQSNIAYPWTFFHRYASDKR